MVLVIMDGESLRSHWEVARENGAPPELLDLLSSLRTLPVFPTVSGYYEKELSASWRGHIYPAQRVDRDGLWHTALLRAEQVAKLLPGGMTTFAAFEEAQTAVMPGQQAN